MHLVNWQHGGPGQRALWMYCAVVFIDSEVSGRTLARRSPFETSTAAVMESLPFDGGDWSVTEQWSPQRYHDGETRSRRSAPTYAPLRVHFELLDDVIPTVQARLTTSILPRVQAILAATLRVVPVIGNLTIHAAGSGDVYCALPSAVIPEAHLDRGGAGLPVDTVIYVTGTGCGEGSNTLGYSAPCFRDQYDRPIAGVVVLCPSGQDTDDNTTTALILHEAVHILGFSDASYQYFRDCSNGGLNAEGTYECPPRVTRNANGYPTSGTVDVPGILRVDDGGVTRVFAPSVVAAARQYFGCPTLTDIPLEDEGAQSSSGQHWEQRVLAYDVMNSVITLGLGDKYFLSEITLGLLNDSGWYEASLAPVTLSTIESVPQWGRGSGCSILDCPADTESPAAAASTAMCATCSAPTFCNPTGLNGCSYDMLDKSRCNPSQFMNGCHAFLPVVGGSCIHSDPTTAPAGEVYGISSRCFGAVEPLRASPRCLRQRCSPPGRLLVEAQAGEYEPCDHETDTVSGTVSCPDPAALCPAPTTQYAHDTALLEFSLTGQSGGSQLYDSIAPYLEALIAREIDDELAVITVRSVTTRRTRVVALVEVSSDITLGENNNLTELMAALWELVVARRVYLVVNTVVVPAARYSGDDTIVGNGTISAEDRHITGAVAIIGAIVVVLVLVVVITLSRRRRHQKSAIVVLGPYTLPELDRAPSGRVESVDKSPPPVPPSCVVHTAVPLATHAVIDRPLLIRAELPNLRHPHALTPTKTGLAQPALVTESITQF